MSHDFFWQGIQPFGWPKHSENCFVTPDQLCFECYGLLAPVPISQRRRIWERNQALKQQVPDPLPPMFLYRLAAALAANPQIFAPIMQQLNLYTKEPR